MSKKVDTPSVRQQARELAVIHSIDVETMRSRIRAGKPVNKPACRRGMTKADNRRAARKFINAVKRQPCMDCGCPHPPWVMDFDHARGKKKFNIGLSGERTIAAIAQEMDKCDLVCSNCHRHRTHMRRLARRAAEGVN